jgi:hypothetical protein
MTDLVTMSEQRVVEGEVVEMPAAARKPLDLERAQLLVAAPKEVKTPEDFAAADQWRQTFAAFRKRAWFSWDQWVNVLYKRHQQACAQRSVFFAEPDTVDQRLHKQMDAVRRQEAAERRAQELAETERQQAALLAEQKRQAAVLQKAGHTDQAKALRTAPAPPVAPVRLASRLPDKTHSRFREVWVGGPAGFTGDPEKDRDGYKRACKAAAQLLPREYLIPDEAALRDFATANKGTVKVPGWKFWKETQR